MSFFFNNREYIRFNLFRFIYYFPHFAKLYWRLFRDARVPLSLKLMLVGAVIYFISPIDIIPEIINPLFGIIDDVAIVSLALKYFIKLAPQDVVEEHVRQIGSKG